jgi:hypothetical protein
MPKPCLLHPPFPSHAMRSKMYTNRVCLFTNSLKISKKMSISYLSKKTLFLLFATFLALLTPKAIPSSAQFIIDSGNASKKLTSKIPHKLPSMSTSVSWMNFKFFQISRLYLTRTSSLLPSSTIRLSLALLALSMFTTLQKQEILPFDPLSTSSPNFQTL